MPPTSNFVTWFVILLLLNVVNSQQQQQSLCGPPSDSFQYNWETYDYYTILGVSIDQNSPRSKRQHIRSRIDSQQIRKAYRKQAQKHHPDKVHRSKNSTVSIEESTARFARISEAYEVLGDSEKRHDYDLWLLQCEDHNNEKPKVNARGDSWSVFDSFTDPRRVFEEYFFDTQGPALGKKGRSQQPQTVEESQEFLFDPYTGQDILRVRRAEYFASDASGRFLYRLVAQDYVERYDKVNGWEYVPISSPIVLEEGFRAEGNILRDDRNQAEVLGANEIMTQRSKPLASENGRYYAGLTADCDLVVVSRDLGETNDSIKWSAGTYVPPAAAECFLSLQGPYLVLALGDAGHPGQILWNSDVPDELHVDGFDRARGPSPVYFVKLDNDGILAVYTQRSVPKSNKKGETGPERDRFWRRGARIFGKLTTWVRRNILRNRSENSERDSDDNQSPVPKCIVCIFATGQAGCNASARMLLHLGQDVRDRIRRAVKMIDTSIDSIFELIMDEEDDDLLDSVSRIAGKVTKAGSALAKRAIRILQKRLG